MIEGGEPGQGSNLLTGECTKFRHTNEKGQGRTRSDAGNALDQRQATGQICVSSDIGAKGFEFCQTYRFKTFNLGGDELAVAGLMESFQASLAADDVLFNLLDER